MGWTPSVYPLAAADRSWRVVESHRLTRMQFERWFVNRAIQGSDVRYLGRCSLTDWLDISGLSHERQVLVEPSSVPTLFEQDQLLISDGGDVVGHRLRKSMAAHTRRREAWQELRGGGYFFR